METISHSGKTKKKVIYHQVLLAPPVLLAKFSHLARPVGKKLHSPVVEQCNANAQNQPWVNVIGVKQQLLLFRILLVLHYFYKRGEIPKGMCHAFCFREIIYIETILASVVCAILHSHDRLGWLGRKVWTKTWRHVQKTNGARLRSLTPV